MTEMGQSRSDKYNVQGAVGSQSWVAFACQRYQLGKECRRAAQCACRGCPAQQMDTLMIAAALSVKIRLQRQNGARQEGNVADLPAARKYERMGRQRQAGSQSCSRDATHVRSSADGPAWQPGCRAGRCRCCCRLRCLVTPPPRQAQRLHRPAPPPLAAAAATLAAGSALPAVQRGPWPPLRSAHCQTRDV